MFTLNWDYEQVKMKFTGKLFIGLVTSQVKMGKQGMNLASTY